LFPGFRHYWREASELFSSACPSSPSFLLRDSRTQPAFPTWSGHCLISRTPTSETGFLCDVELVISWPQFFFFQMGPFLPFPSLSPGFQTFRAHSPCSLCMSMVPCSDVLSFAGISVITYRTEVLLGEVCKGFFTDG